jgi:DNA sulfur modification protein DndD
VAQALDESGSAIERLKMVRTVQRALHDYQEEGTKVKIQSLEQEVTRCFGQLCHKDNLVDRIEVDGKSYETRLYEKSGNLLLKDDLSAGERQILAIAILWALGRTSGRPLPVMVDTPLARLDGKHRSLLLERYFPHASHQVILFSTDTEVDRKFFETIRKNISHSFHLRYDSTERRTHVDEGYFWKSSKRNTEDPPSALLG